MYYGCPWLNYFYARFILNLHNSWERTLTPLSTSLYNQKKSPMVMYITQKPVESHVEQAKGASHSWLTKMRSVSFFSSTWCPAKHDSWLTVLNVFFHDLLSSLMPKKIIIVITWSTYCSKIDKKIKYIWVKVLFNEINCKYSLISYTV